MRRRAIPGGWPAQALSAALVVALAAALVAPPEAVARRRTTKHVAHSPGAAPGTNAADSDTTWGTTGSSVDVGGTPQQADSAGAHTPFDGLGWLNGCWALEDGKRRVAEEWTTSGGVLMLGSARQYAKPKYKVTEEERTRIEFKNGQYLYIAAPSSQPADSFAAVEVTGARIVFENPRHDFPQRIGYELVAPDSVLGWIEGTQDGNPRRVEYPYHREACGQSLGAR